MTPQAENLELPSLADAAWLRREETQAVFEMLERTGFPAMAVGGAVRNGLMGLPVADLDIATPAMPEQVIAACRVAGLQSVETGLAHGTVTVIANHVPYEVTTLRRDVSTDGRHATVAYSSDWRADAARRDFTVNALYCDRSGRVLDPLGGYPDIISHRIRFIGDPDKRIAEDYLRILRFFRFFAAFGKGNADRHALDACVRGRIGLATLSAERKRSELLKLLVAERVLDAIVAMVDFGLLTSILGLAPRPTVLRRLCEAEQSTGAEADPILRLAALSVAVGEDAHKLRARLRLTNRESNSIVAVTRAAAQEVEALDERTARQALYRLGTAEWRRRVLAAMAGGAGSKTLESLYELPQLWPVPRFPLRGSDVLGLGGVPGLRVGAILKNLEQWWIGKDFPNEEVLRQQLRSVTSEK